jgi:hypothetical protein
MYNKFGSYQPNDIRRIELLNLIRNTGGYDDTLTPLHYLTSQQLEYTLMGNNIENNIENIETEEERFERERAEDDLATILADEIVGFIYTIVPAYTETPNLANRDVIDRIREVRRYIVDGDVTLNLLREDHAYLRNHANRIAR